MNKFFLPTSRKVLPTFQIFCPIGVQIAQKVVHFAHFQVQARKKGGLGWALGRFVYVHIPERGVWHLSKEQGLGVVFWAKWYPIWAKWDPSGQFVRKVGKSALELEKKNLIMCRWNLWKVAHWQSQYERDGQWGLGRTIPQPIVSRSAVHYVYHLACDRKADKFVTIAQSVWQQPTG